MRKFSRKIAFFLFSLLLILMLMNYRMDYESNPHYPLQYDEVFYPKVKADLVIVGASQAAHGINPKYLESEHLKVFNFALGGAPPSFYLKWYDKIFSQYYPKPSYMIYAVHWNMFDDIITPRQIEHDSGYFPLPFFIKQLGDVGSLQTLLSYRFAFCKYRKEALTMLFDKRKEIYPKAKYYNGFIPFKERKKLRKTDIVNPKVNPVQLKAFVQFLNDCERDGIKVIFVHVPGYLYGRETQNILKNVQLIKGIAEKRGIPWLDYETERISSINMNDDLFADWIHMSEEGSEAFSKLLKQDLESLLKRM